MIIRSILSVLTGLAVFFLPVFILWTAFGYGAGDIPADWFFAVSIGVEILLGFAAGFITALLAKNHRLLLCGFLAGLLALQNLAYIFAGPEGSPIWPYAISLILVTPAVILGGLVCIKCPKKA